MRPRFHGHLNEGSTEDSVSGSFTYHLRDSDLGGLELHQGILIFTEHSCDSNVDGLCTFLKTNKQTKITTSKKTFLEIKEGLC